MTEMTANSTLEKLLKQGEFVVTAEIGPPQSANGDAVRKKTSHFKGCVDAVNITDNQTGYDIRRRRNSAGFGEPDSYFEPRRFQLTVAFQF